MKKQILQDVKKSIGINPDSHDETFDASIIMCINSAIAELAELGIGTQGGFEVDEGTETWEDYLGETYAYLLSLSKSYVNTYVKLMFDTPQSGALKAALEEDFKRLEFRILTAIEQHED